MQGRGTTTRRRPRAAAVLAVLLTVSATTLAAHPGRGIAVDGRGRIWFVDTARDILWRLDGRDGLVRVAGGMHSDRLFLIGDSAVTAESHFATALVPRFERLRQDMTFPSRGDAVRLAGDPFAFAALDRDGNAYFLLNGSLLVLTPTDSLRERAHGLPLGSAVSASVARDGSVYLVVGNRVWDIPRGGGVRAATDTGAFAFVSAVAARDSAGTCVVDYGARRVHVYGGEGGMVRDVRWPWYPVGAAAGPDGACYVLERRFAYGGLGGVVGGWMRDLLGTPRVRRIDHAGAAETLVVVAHRLTVVPLLTLTLALAGVVGLWLTWRRRGRVAA